MISTKNVEENKAPVSKFIKPGIGEYKIAHMSKFKSPVGSEGITLHMESKPMADLNNECQSGDFVLYMTEKAMKYSLSQIVDIAGAIGVPKEELDKITAPDLDSYITQVSPIIVGHFLRFKFRGEEILSQTTGNKWLKASLPTYSFVEPIGEATKLKFDESKDIKKLPVADVEDMTTTSGEKSDDLPF